MHWKIKRDYYYNELYTSLGLAGIEEAGFFEDTATIDYKVIDSCRVLCTPITPITKEIHQAKKPCVLLTTGSFCPIHQGHIDMMVNAKNAVKQAGYDVLAGYISPGHDEYINLKVKEKAIPVHYRLQLIQELIEANHQENWLMPDSWEGIFNAVAVNFTDVVYRLELYLEQLFGQKIPVFFVCGGDNARFALTFQKKGYCVVVGRPSYDEQYINYKNKLKELKNILWIEGNNPLSSTFIRNKNNFKENKKKSLHLRVEEEDTRETAIIRLLKPYYNSIHYAYVSQQKKLFQKICPKDTISLDAYLESDYNLGVSRCFDLLGLYKLGYTNRPDTPPLDEQMYKIPKGGYCLFDDDIHTGNTIKFIQKKLENHGSKALAIWAMNLYQKKDNTNAEVLDCRDFIIGGSQNGLVLNIKNQLVRAPYIYPYVCPFVRASIHAPLDFSIAVWKINQDYYQVHPLLLESCSKSTQTLYKLVGFSNQDSLAFICEWHVNLLSKFLKS